MSIQYLVDLSQVRFRGIDFRSYYLIQHLGRTVRVRIQQILDFHYCSQIFTPITFIPEVQVSDLCGLVSGDPVDEPVVCDNFPRVNCTYNGGCYTFTVGGINNSVIESVVWQKKLVIANSWTNVGTNMSYIDCAETEDYEVRAIVTYEGDCPDITTTAKLVEPCTFIAFFIECVKTTVVGDPATYTSARISHTNPNIDDSDINTISFEFSDGSIPITWQPYVEGDLIHPDNLGSGQFRATVQYRNCPSEMLIGACSDPPQTPSLCSAVDVQLVCVPDGSCFQFELQGTIPFLFDIDYTIKWRDGDTDSWKVYNEGETVCGVDVQGKVLIHFCDDACPTICLYATCEGCTEVFDIGSPSNNAYCNDGNV
jgi:hypothetical protein